MSSTRLLASYISVFRYASRPIFLYLFLFYCHIFQYILIPFFCSYLLIFKSLIISKIIRGRKTLHTVGSSRSWTGPLISSNHHDFPMLMSSVLLIFLYFCIWVLKYHCILLPLLILLSLYDIFPFSYLLLYSFLSFSNSYPLVSLTFCILPFFWSFHFSFFWSSYLPCQCLFLNVYLNMDSLNILLVLRTILGNYAWSVHLS